MTILERLEDFKNPCYPLVLTIGNFDGMHRGHQALLKEARSLAGSEGKVVAITFRNHPSEILRPEQPVCLLNSLPHKLSLLGQTSIDTLILLSFTRYLAEHSAASFIERVRHFIPFSHLLLGHDATLGRDRQGDRATMHALSEQWGFSLHYLEEYRFEGQPVSSSRIRKALQEGNLEIVEQLLGRPYSLYGKVIEGQGLGKKIDWPTANLEVKGLCLPPFGVYAVEGQSQEKRMPGIANLGVAPTIRMDSSPLLEVHFLDYQEELGDQPIEIFFKKFIRPEKKFNSIAELQKQIALDIKQLISM